MEAVLILMVVKYPIVMMTLHHLALEHSLHGLVLCSPLMLVLLKQDGHRPMITDKLEIPYVSMESLPGLGFSMGLLVILEI